MSPGLLLRRAKCAVGLHHWCYAGGGALGAADFVADLHHRTYVSTERKCLFCPRTQTRPRAIGAGGWKNSDG